MQEQKGVEAVERALKILDCFDPAVPDLSLAEIANETGFYKSTILRLSVSLERFDYIVRGDNGRFRLGPAAWRIGATYRQSFDLSEILRPELKWLSEATNETASYYVREGMRRVCLYRSEPVRSIRHAISEGASMPLDRGASGKVLLAFSADNDEGDGAIREAGYAVSLGERDPEVAAISVPLQALSGRLIGALSVSGLITRFKKDRYAHFLEAMRESQKRLSEQVTN